MPEIASPSPRELEGNGTSNARHDSSKGNAITISSNESTSDIDEDEDDVQDEDYAPSKKQKTTNGSVLTARSTTDAKALTGVSSSAKKSGRKVRSTRTRNARAIAESAASRPEHTGSSDPNDTPPCAQVQGECTPAPFVPSSVAKTPPRSDVTASSPLLVIKQRPKSSRLFEDSSSKRTSVIAFDEHGPLNQGRSSVPPAEHKVPDKTSMTYKNGNDIDMKNMKRYETREQRCESRSEVKGGKDVSGCDLSSKHPLAGYAQFVSSAILQSQHEDDDLQEIDQLGRLSTVASLPEDKDVFHTNRSNEGFETLHEQDGPTLSQIVMPPPAAPVRPPVKLRVATLESSVSAHTGLVTVETHNPKMADVDGQSSHETQQVQQSPDQNEEASERDDANEKQDPAKASSEDHDYDYGKAADLVYIQKQPVSTTGDSGYQSMQIKHKHISSMVPLPPSSRITVAVSKTGSPFAVIRAARTPEPNPRVKSAEESSIPCSNNPFHLRRLDITQAIRPTADDFKRILRRTSSTQKILGSSEVDSDGELPTDADAVVANEAPSSAAHLEPDNAAFDRQEVEHILEWRSTLPQNQASLFNTLIDDAYQLVQELARREDLLQSRINVFRSKGHNLVEELAEAYAQEREHFFET